MVTSITSRDVAIKGKKTPVLIDMTSKKTKPYLARYGFEIR